MRRNMRDKGMKLAHCARFAGKPLRSTAVRLGLLTGLLTGLMVAGTSVAAEAQAIKPAEPVRYDNKYELYGGLSLDTFEAGRYVQKRMNLGGVEALGTYWLTNRVGLGLDLRGEAGTTPVLPNVYFNGRQLVSQYMAMAGAQVRGPRNAHFALNYHAYAGMDKGVFDQGDRNYMPQDLGLYSNRIKPAAAVGISIDINRSARWAVRISPDMMLRRFGNEWDENFAMSGGVIYRFGKR